MEGDLRDSRIEPAKASLLSFIYSFYSFALTIRSSHRCVWCWFEPHIRHVILAIFFFFFFFFLAIFFFFFFFFFDSVLRRTPRKTTWYITCGQCGARTHTRHIGEIAKFCLRVCRMDFQGSRESSVFFFMCVCVCVFFFCCCCFFLPHIRL